MTKTRLRRTVRQRRADCPTETGGLSAGHTPGKCDSEDLLKIPVRNYRRTIRCRVRTVRRQFSTNQTESRPCWNSEPGGADSPRRFGRTVRVLESSRPEAGGARPRQPDCPGFATRTVRACLDSGENPTNSKSPLPISIQNLVQTQSQVTKLKPSELGM